MNWFKGSIVEAVACSKQRDAVFVVYVEGNDPNSARMTKLLDEPVIKNKLERDCFVVIKIEGGSDAYMQFARIYQIVPLPSLFFIGKNGAPLEIATGISISVDELNVKIDKVLKLTGKSDQKLETSASATFIAKEKANEAETVPVGTTSNKSEEDSIVIEQTTEKPTSSKVAEAASKPTDTDTPATTEMDKPEKLITDVVCFEETNLNEPECPAVASDTSSVNLPPAPCVTPASSNIEVETSVDKEEVTKQIQEAEQKAKEAEKEKQEHEKELKRRQDGKNTQNFQQWQREQDFKDLVKSIQRDRMEDNAARQRILEQIAGDRAERAHNLIPATTPTPPNQASTPSNANTSNLPNVARIQFRIPNGETNTQVFESSDTFATVRCYVKGEVLTGTGIREFSLTTTFPRREFTSDDDAKTLIELGLCPSAVILIIAKSTGISGNNIIPAGGVLTVLSTVFWTVVSPVVAFFDYCLNMIKGRRGGPPSNPRTRKHSKDTPVENSELTTKRNIDGLLAKEEPSTSPKQPASSSSTYRRVAGSNIHRLLDQRKDSDDENNTWNGNSTQQQ